MGCRRLRVEREGITPPPTPPPAAAAAAAPPSISCPICFLSSAVGAAWDGGGSAAAVKVKRGKDNQKVKRENEKSPAPRRRCCGDERMSLRRAISTRWAGAAWDGGPDGVPAAKAEK